MIRFFVTILCLYAASFAGVISQSIVSVENEDVTIRVDTIEVGMSGFIVKHLDKEHSAILKTAVVTAFDKEKKIARLHVSDFTQLDQDALPSGKWSVAVGDEAVIAGTYSRALLIAPSEEIYHRVTKALPSLQWVHPNLFASILSLNGHPTPLKKDFQQMCEISAVGLLYMYIHENLFTLDCQSMGILNIADAPLKQASLQLPFYSRVSDINANWFGEGSRKLKVYDPYYYELLVTSNPTNKAYYNFIKNKEQNMTQVLEKFEIKDAK